MKLKALYNAVIVKHFEFEEERYGNIIVPDLGKEKNILGKVIAVGDGYYSANGTWLNTFVKEDDIVVLPTMGFSKLFFEGEEYLIGPENQILAVIANNENKTTDELPF